MKRIFALIGPALIGLVAAVKPKNIHDLNDKIQKGVSAWNKFYGYAKELVPAQVEAVADFVADAITDTDGGTVNQDPVPPPVVVTA